jgi:periplasmic protein TonB
MINKRGAFQDRGEGLHLADTEMPMTTASYADPFVERRKQPRPSSARRFFDNLVVSGSARRSRAKALLLPVTAALHVVALAAFVLVPLLVSQDLPDPTTAGGIRAFFVEPVAAPPPPPPPPAPAKPAQAAAVTKPARMEAPKTTPVTPRFVAPIETPPELPKEQSVGTEGLAVADTGVAGGVEGGSPAGVEGGVSGGIEGGVVGGVEGGEVGGTLGGQVGGVVGGEPKAKEPPKPVRVGGKISEPKKLKNVAPVYPEVAKQARVQGTVVLEATIDPSGRVDNLRVLRGIPLLNDAALDAVRKWVYSPTLLNGSPVPVIMTVTVNFTLN